MTQQKEATIGNAGAIIARFGGIRPMASKIKVPVTTVQGWKKRDAIPATRLEQIQQAAREHSIEIADILNASSIANENAKTPQARSVPSFKQELKSEVKKEPGADVRATPLPRGAINPATMPNVVYEDFAKKLSETEKKAVAKSAVINMFLVVVMAGVVALMLWPRSPISQDGRHMAALEEKVAQLRVDVAGVKKEQSTMDTIVPAELQQKISELEQQVQTVGANAAANAAATATASTQQAAEMFGPASTAVEQRIAKLESQVSTIAGSSSLASVMDRFMAMQASTDGQAQITAAWNELSNFVFGFQGSPQDLAAALQTAKDQNPGLAAALQGVEPQDLKAATLLFAMSQVRSALGRENVPVDKDLQVLKSLAGADDPELTAAVDRLAPLAGAGFVTPGTLSGQFETIAGNIVNASLQGSDVTITERAKARLGQMLQIEKDGQLISGTPAQAAVAKTKTLLAQGDIMGAITEMQTLSGPAATEAAPWITQANATLLAQQLKTTLTRTINLRAYGRGGVTTADAPIVSNPADLYKPASLQ